MRIAIFGATGCIGRNLIDAFNTTQDKIIAFYRNEPGIERINLSWVKYDLNSDDDLSEYLKGVELVYYLIHSLDHKEFFHQESVYAQK